SLGADPGEFAFGLRSRWLDASGERTVSIVGDIPHLAYDLAPGETVPVPLTLAPPAAPGDYLLEVHMLHEGVGLFLDRGSQPLRLAVRVAR
ncbi:MAG TPA: hypothetical protein VF064_21120, partial [Pyrinomonadaceae bacterium]